MADAELDVGARAPDFRATDEQDRQWQLSEMLRRGAVVLVFYRGDW